MSLCKVGSGRSADNDMGLVAAFACLVIGQAAVQLNSAGPLAVAGLTLHLLAITIVIAGRAEIGPLPQRQSRPLAEAGVSAGLILLSAGLYIIGLSDFPYRVDGDAAAQANNAMLFLGPSPPPLVGLGWLDRSNFYFFLESLGLWVFGPTLVGMRIFGAVGGILAVLFTFLFARSVLGLRPAAFAAAGLAIMPFHVTFARTGLESEHTVWLAPLTFWLILLGWERRSKLFLMGGGAAAGLALYFYQSALVLPLLIAAQLTLLAGCEYRTTHRADAMRRFAVAAPIALGGFIAAYFPMISYALDRPDVYFGRIGSVSILGSGWLASELQTRSLVEVMSTAILRSSLPFHYPTPGPGYIFHAPYLTIFESAAFTLGLAILWIGRLGPSWFRWFVAVQFAAGISLLGVFTVDSPIAARYALLIPTVAIMIGLACDRLLDRLRTRLSGWTAGGLAVLAVACHTGLGFSDLIARDRASLRNGTVADIIGTRVGRTLAAEQELDYRVLFLSLPSLGFGSHPGLKFLTQRDGVDIPESAGCRAIAAAMEFGVNYIIVPTSRLDDVTPFRQARWMPRMEVVSGRPDARVAGLLRLVIPKGDSPAQACRGAPDSAGADYGWFKPAQLRSSGLPDEE